MIDLARIRNASFTLTPTGYNPEEVDQFLADLADELASTVEQGPVATPLEPVTPVFERPAFERPAFEAPAPLEAPAATLAHRPDGERGQLSRLQGTFESTIAALDGFVQNELAALKAASELQIEDVYAERERLLDEAASAARAHLDEARSRGEEIVADAHRDAAELRRRFEERLEAERARFEEMLAEREAREQARVAELIGEAEERRRYADELVGNAQRVQAQILASLETARASIGMVAGESRPAQQQPFGRSTYGVDAPSWPAPDAGSTDAAA